MTLTIIHLDDEIQILDAYAKAFTQFATRHAYQIKSCSNVSELKAELAQLKDIDAFIIDINLGVNSESGLSMAAHCKSLYPKALIFISSSTRDPRLIHSSLCAGADDFIPKDLSVKNVVNLVESKLHQSLMDRHRAKDTKPVTGAFIMELYKRIPQIIDSAVNCVHAFGETGTGKEVVADIFESSLPLGTPFVRVNCGAIPTALVTSEMFGHTKGSFTGAVSDKIGLIETAHNGWLFLDEVATLPLDAQASLLRAIDNQKVRRIGSNKDSKVNFRIISATNESLDKLVFEGKFRKDLWQRLRETEIILPPLRDRSTEVTDLVYHFCTTMRGGPYRLAPTVMSILKSYDWREGNIRELRNCLRSMTEKSTDRLLTPKCIPDRVWSQTLGKLKATSQQVSGDLNLAKNKVEVTWHESDRPNFEKLSLILLLNLIHAEHDLHGQLSMRSLAKSLGIPKSSLPKKIQLIVQRGITKQSEIDRLIAGSQKLDFTLS